MDCKMLFLVEIFWIQNSFERSRTLGWWAHQDLNLEPTDYESAALTN